MRIPSWLQELRVKVESKTHPFDKVKVDLEKPNAILELMLHDPDLMNHYQNFVGFTVKRDEHIKNIVLFTGLSALVPDFDTKLTPINLFLKGESSTGKTYNTTETMKLFPDDIVWNLGGMSPKALIHGFGDLVDKDGNPIDLSEKPSNRKPSKRKTESEEQYVDRLREWETDRLTWQEKMKESKYVIDLNGKVLVFLEAPPIETFMMLRPILSHDVYETSFRFVDKSGAGSLQTRNVVIRGWCATIFCTAKCEYLEEISTRSFTASPLATSDKYRDAVDLIGERVANPLKFQRDYEKGLLKDYVTHIQETQYKQEEDAVIPKKPYFVLNPFAHLFTKAYPTTEARSMRDIQHILALMNCSAIFHYRQRPMLRTQKRVTGDFGDLELGRDDYVLVTFRDLERVFSFLPAIAETTITGMPQYTLDLFLQVLIPLYEERGNVPYDLLIDTHNEKMQNKLSYGSIRRMIKSLADSGYVTTVQDETDKRKKLIKVIKKVENPFETVLINFLESFSKEDFIQAIKDFEETNSDIVDVSIKRPYENTAWINATSDEKNLETIYEHHYKFDESLRNTIEKAIRVQSESRGITTIDEMFKQKETPKASKAPANGKDLLNTLGINYGRWLNRDERTEGDCGVCGANGELTAEFNSLTRGKIQTCEGCGEKILDELNNEMNDHDYEQDGDGDEE